jgi:hypothetical protein
MDWKNEQPARLASTLGVERTEQIDDEVCSLLYHFGPDRHIDGHDEITAYVCGVISAERERCAQVLADYADVNAYDPEEHDDLMEIVERIRSALPASTQFSASRVRGHEKDEKKTG